MQHKLKRKLLKQDKLITYYYFLDKELLKNIYDYKFHFGLAGAINTFRLINNLKV